MDEHHSYAFSPEEWEICLKVLTSLKDQPELLKQLNLIFENNSNFVEIKI